MSSLLHFDFLIIFELWFGFYVSFIIQKLYG